MPLNKILKYDRAENLGDPYIGAWYVPELILPSTSQIVMAEVIESGKVEPIRVTKSSVNQIFERMVVDFTREHDFPELEYLGQNLGRFLVNSAGHMFPALRDYSIDEAAVQIYPAGTELALGWHKDHEEDGIVVISAVLSGAGEIGFTDKDPKEDITEADICLRAMTQALGVMYFRANGLFEREDGSDIRETHAVTKILEGEDRFSVQFRMGVNAPSYQNVPVNHDRALRVERPALL